MILLAALAQAAAAAPATPVPAVSAPASLPAAETVRPIDPVVAIDLFKSVCWASFRDPQAFHAAVAAAAPPLAPVAHAPADPAQPSEVFRGDGAVLTYVASDTLPASIPSRQCSLRVRLAAAADQLALVARIATALGLPNGRTRTGRTLAITIWDVVAADSRIMRLLAVSGNGRGGGTELRLSALLLAPR